MRGRGRKDREVSELLKRTFYKKFIPNQMTVLCWMDVGKDVALIYTVHANK